ncbi:MAG: hypothetical protein AAF492_12660, partial [Verrucomicrobiota bacterium]
MKKLIMGLFMVSSLAVEAANEIGYVETFSLSGNRPEALKQLIPGTRDYYYYHCLHFQNIGDRASYDKFLEQFIKRHRHTSRVRELQNRQALIDYDKNAKGSLDHIRRQLNLNFNHKRRLENQKSSAPTKLDPKLISVETLKARAFRSHRNLHGFEHEGLDAVAGDKLDATRRRDLLARLQRPDYPNLVDLVFEDLKAKDSRGFGHHKIHARMLASQLEALLKKKPDLKNNSNFVRAWLSKLAPGHDVNLEQNAEAREAYYDRLRDYVKTLDPVHNSLKANVLYHRLIHDRNKGTYDKARFMDYIKLPRNVHYVNRKWYDGQNHRYRVNTGQSFGEISLPAIGNEEPIVMEYLAHFFIEEESYKAYEPWLRDTVLKRVFATTKILHGIGDVEQWASMLTPSEYKSLKERVDLDFAPWNRKYFSPDDPVSLELYVKNVKDLIVKVF